MESFYYDYNMIFLWTLMYAFENWQENIMYAWIVVKELKRSGMAL